jgi:hypothetical protein
MDGNIITKLYSYWMLYLIFFIGLYNRNYIIEIIIMSDIMQPLLNKIIITTGKIKRNAVNIVEKINSEQLLEVMICIKNFLHTGKIDVLEDNGETDNFNLYLVRNGLSAIDLKRLMNEILQDRPINKNVIIKDTEVNDSPLTNAGMQQALYLNEYIKNSPDNILQSTILTSYMRSSIETAILAMQGTDKTITPMPYTRQDKMGGSYNPNFSNIKRHNAFAKINGVDFNSNLFSKQLMQNIFHDRTKMRFSRISKQPFTNTHIGKVSNITNYTRMFKRYFLKVLAITLIVSVNMVSDSNIEQLNIINKFMNKTFTLFTNSQFIRRLAGLKVDVHPIGIIKLVCKFNSKFELEIVRKNQQPYQYIGIDEKYITGTSIIRPTKYQATSNNRKNKGKVESKIIIKNNIHTNNNTIRLIYYNLEIYFLYFDSTPVINHPNPNVTSLGDINKFGYIFNNMINDSNTYVFPLTLYTARMFKKNFHNVLENAGLQNESFNKFVINLQTSNNNNNNNKNKMRIFAERMLIDHLYIINNHIEAKAQRNAEAKAQRNAEAKAVERQRRTEATERDGVWFSGIRSVASGIRSVASGLIGSKNPVKPKRSVAENEWIHKQNLHNGNNNLDAQLAAVNTNWNPALK